MHGGRQTSPCFREIFFKTDRGRLLRKLRENLGQGKASRDATASASRNATFPSCDAPGRSLMHHTRRSAEECRFLALRSRWTELLSGASGR
eukprot:4126547-Prymnesium_polylepis.1